MGSSSLTSSQTQAPCIWKNVLGTTVEHLWELVYHTFDRTEYNIVWKIPSRILSMGGEGDDRGWDSWMASPTHWTWVWVSSRSWWWTGKPGVLQSMGSQRVRHYWATELNWLIQTYSTDLWFSRGKGAGGGMNWEFGISWGKLLYTGWTNSKILL